jgi:hypothetical protein
VSNALAIAGVTAVLRDLLNEGLINHNIASTVGNVKITSDPPDIIKTTGTAADSRLNLYMYRVTPNPGWRNEGLPARGASGARLSNPPLALDLHYLLTAYGKEQFHTDILLGYGMQLLHETPVLVRDRIRQSLGGVPPVSGADVLPSTYPTLAAADLAEQVEQIRITPEFMNTEEMSKLWSAMQASYRPTAAYVASVVLIESRRPAQAALPVRERNLAVRALNRPVIERASPQLVPSGGTLTLTGYNLRGDITRVALGAVEIVPADPGYERIEITVPASVPAGVTTLQVRHPVDFGTATEPHRGVESNVIACMVLPVVSGVPASVARNADLTLTVAPAVRAQQKATLILGQGSIDLPPRAPGSPALASLSFRIPADFPTGTQLLRVRVDGADSALEVESDGVQPDVLKKQYTGPQVNVT